MDLTLGVGENISLVLGNLQSMYDDHETTYKRRNDEEI